MIVPPSSGIYCLVIRRLYDHDWRFLSILGGRVATFDHPRQFFLEPSDAIREFWIGTAVGRDITHWDEACDLSSLRLIKLRFDVENVTDQLFHDSEDQDQFAKLTAVAKLSDSEARLLGLVKERAKLKLYENIRPQSRDRLVDEASELMICKVLTDAVMAPREGTVPAGSAPADQRSRSGRR